MKIAIFGHGKMGRAIESIVNGSGNFSDHEIILTIDKHNIDSVTVLELSKADVAIEFSTPDAAYQNIIKCFEADVPVVCGTTGWTDKLPELTELCKKEKKSFFYASNFSIGVNIFFEANKLLSKLMNRQSQYDVTLHEVHHTQKLDSPSGTAITIADQIIENIDRKSNWVNENDNEDSTLSILSYRQEDVPGIHIINYESDVDSIELKHSAHSRSGFAQGALMAAEWILGKTGFFGMNDLLQLNK